MVMAAVIGSSVIGAGASMIGSSSAANAQENASANASAVQMGMFNKTQANLSPYMQAGGQFLNQLTGRMGDLTKPFNPTMADLENTPGYKFTLDQGLKATQNGFAAKGLGISGAAMKGGADYASGLASQTYQQQFQNDLASKAQIFNQLLGGASMGENAAAGVGNMAQATGASVGSNIIGAGNAQAGSYMNMANSVGSMANNVSQYAMYNQLLKSGQLGYAP